VQRIGRRPRDAGLRMMQSELLTRYANMRALFRESYGNGKETVYVKSEGELRSNVHLPHEQRRQPRVHSRMTLVEQMVPASTR